MACTIECYAPCCACYSLVGIIFLIIVGILVDKQPIFIKNLDVEKAPAGAKACYLGALIYVATLVLSVMAYAYDNRKKRRRQALDDLQREDHGGTELMAVPNPKPMQQRL